MKRIGNYVQTATGWLRYPGLDFYHYADAWRRHNAGRAVYRQVVKSWRNWKLSLTSSNEGRFIAAPK